MGAAVQGVTGVVQLISGLSKKKPRRPDMQTPQSVTEATNLARQQANTPVRAGNDLAVNDIQQSTANTVNAASDVSSSGTDVLAALSRANNNEQASLRQNNLLNAQYTNNAKSQLISQLNGQGQYEQMAWESNKLARYLEKRRERAELINSGIKNLSESESQSVDQANKGAEMGVSAVGSVGGAASMFSDERLKRDVIPLKSSLNTINQTQGVHYKWNDVKPNDMESLQTGFIAQEVKMIFPELVKEDAEGYLSIDYIGFIPHLVEAVKELQTENAAEVAGLESRLYAIESMLASQKG